ncbi:MAG TPA: hypothetical protein PL048_23200, partial [Leptospiraceae bacterium]|nr:hypothetical protein [Leptospiraceae bacterium]
MVKWGIISQRVSFGEWSSHIDQMRHNLSKSLVPRVEILQDRMGHNPPESLFLRVEFPQSKKQGGRFRGGFP